MSQEIYSGHTVSAKSQNNYEIAFTGSESKISIGSGTSLFNPKLTFSRWNEVEFSLDLPRAFTGNLGNGSLLSDKASFSNANYGFEFLPTPPKEGFNDLGGLDFIITLKRKPPINSLSFTFSQTGVEAYLQPPLTQAEIDEGAIRPDYVVNSIAFYATGKSGDYTALGGKNYKAGKVGHLYRLKAIDALGKWVWTDWNVVGNLISLTVPQSFLDTAIYPVALMPIGDTFGYTSIGLTERGPRTANYMRFYNGGYLGASGTVTSLSYYGKLSSAGNLQTALYTKSGSTYSLVTNGSSNTLPITTNLQWWDTVFANNPTITAQTYYLLFNTDVGCLLYLDAASGYAQIKAQTFGTWPSTFSSPSNDVPEQFSIYVTYTPSGGGTLPIIVNGLPALFGNSVLLG